MSRRGPIPQSIAGSVREIGRLFEGAGRARRDRRNSRFVFSPAREAIRAAVDRQQRFVEETLEQPELPLTVGIGLDAGEAVAVQGGYRGVR